MADFDLAIIGGGINGAGIARDAAGRGLKVVLIEQNDLAAGASSASSKLIHGGLRYLEHGALRLVRTALREREVLLRMAPHLIQPLRFVLPLGAPASRSPFVLRVGLFLYDLIGRRQILPPTRALDLIIDLAGQPLKRSFHHGYEYSDCFADDARLVVLNAVDAAERGAVIRTRTRCVRAERTDIWQLILNARGVREVVTARVLVNATGAYVETFAETVLRQRPRGRLRLDKGSHIVVPRLYDHDRAYILQAADGRVLNRRLRDVLDGGSAYFFANVLRSLSSVPEVEFVEKIISGHRRWWIGSLLNYLESSRCFPEQDVMRFVSLTEKILRGRDCGRAIPKPEFSVAAFPLPIHPEDDTDLSMGVWTADEAAFVVDLFRRVKDQNPQFREPPERTGLALMTDLDWNDWVHEMIDQILKIDQLVFEETRIITFINS